VSIEVGTRVVTVKPEQESNDWLPGALAKRKWRMTGTVVAYHDSHGVVWDVKHDDGTTGPYETRELRELKPDPLDNMQHPDALREVARAALKHAARAQRLLRRVASNGCPEALRQEVVAYLRDFDAKCAEAQERANQRGEGA
jgi:hypothetical protein